MSMQQVTAGQPVSDDRVPLELLTVETGEKPEPEPAPLFRACLAEAMATFILVFFGIGSVHTAVLTEMQAGAWQVIIWGVAVSLGIYTTGAVCGAHMNPAITLAFTVFRKFPVRRILPYLAAQFAGGFAAAAVLYALFGNIILHFEQVKGIVRGMPGSELSAMVYGEYFPNPAIFGTGAGAVGEVTLVQAVLAEAIGTALLAFFVFAITDGRNAGRSHGKMTAPLIGLALAIIISIIAPLTQAGLNPVRDFAPRVFALLAGWGSIAIPGPRGGFFTVYILGPFLGALVGAAIYHWLVRPAHAVPEPVQS